MLHPSCLIVKKGERRRKNEGSGFFDLKKQCEMVVLSFILHAPSFMLIFRLEKRWLINQAMEAKDSNA